MDISAKALCALPPDDSKGRVQIDTASHPCSGNGVLVSVWWRGLWLGLGMLLWAAERENYSSLFDTVISLHPMRLCSAFCTLGSASFDCRNVHMCAKDQDVCVWERERETHNFFCYKQIRLRNVMIHFNRVQISTKERERLTRELFKWFHQPVGAIREPAAVKFKH